MGCEGLRPSQQANRRALTGRWTQMRHLLASRDALAGQGKLSSGELIDNLHTAELAAGAAIVSLSQHHER
jgi:hypothetical protein